MYGFHCLLKEAFANLSLFTEVAPIFAQSEAWNTFLQFEPVSIVNDEEAPAESGEEVAMAEEVTMAEEVAIVEEVTMVEIGTTVETADSANEVAFTGTVVEKEVSGPTIPGAEETTDKDPMDTTPAADATSEGASDQPEDMAGAKDEPKATDEAEDRMDMS